MTLSREVFPKSEDFPLKTPSLAETNQPGEECKAPYFFIAPCNALIQKGVEKPSGGYGSSFRIAHFLNRLSCDEPPSRVHIERYLRHQYRRNLTFETMRNSYGVMLAFLKFLKNRGKSGIEQLDREDLEAFVEHEQDRGLKSSTVKTHLACVKAFVNFLIERKVLNPDVFPWKLKIKLSDPLPRAMDPDDVSRLLTVKASVRDRAMILLLLRTGMRIGELLHTKVNDVIFKEKKILIWESEKNRVGRVVYFTDDARAALNKWLKKRQDRSGFIFYGRTGSALTYSAARNVFMKYLAKAGLSHKGYTIHCLRHTYATELINARMRIEYLRPLLGHTSLEVTRRYARLRDKTREEEYFRAMAIIERSEKDGHNQRDRELQEIFEKTQLLPPHGEELPEHT